MTTLEILRLALGVFISIICLGAALSLISDLINGQFKHDNITLSREELNKMLDLQYSKGYSHGKASERMESNGKRFNNQTTER